MVSTTGINRINFLNVSKLQNLVTKLSKNKCQKILLDLEGISFIDSQAFRKIINLSEKLRRFGTHFKLINLDNELKEIIELIPEAAFLIEVTKEEKVAELIEA